MHWVNGIVAGVPALNRLTYYGVSYTRSSHSRIQPDCTAVHTMCMHILYYIFMLAELQQM